MKTVMITGASSGIGEATAQHFLRQGWKVCATARIVERLCPWSNHSQVKRLALDVTSLDSVKLAVAESFQFAGRIDAVVNNAGVGLAGPLEAISMDEVESHFQTNVFGACRVIQAVLPIFREQGCGVIVNVSSVVGRFGVPFMSPYCAGKFAIEGLSESLYYELLPFDVRVKLIEPGGIKTRFRQVFAQHDAYHPSLHAVESRVAQSEGPNSTLPGPHRVAAMVFRAVTDGSDQLRYPVETQGAALLHRILPERVWRKVIRKSFKLGSSSQRES